MRSTLKELATGTVVAGLLLMGANAAMAQPAHPTAVSVVAVAAATPTPTPTPTNPTPTVTPDTTTDLCINSGSGACQAQGEDNVQQELGAPKAEFTYLFQGYVGCATACWPFAEGTGYNNAYSGDAVEVFQDTESGDCLTSYNPDNGGVIQTRENSECANSNYSFWVVDGAWLIDVGTSDSNSGDYPYSQVMISGCASSGCKVWVQESGASHTIENAWGI
jgi:hypothetical protein